MKSESVCLVLWHRSCNKSRICCRYCWMTGSWRKESLWKSTVVAQIRLQLGHFVGGAEGNNEKSVWGQSVSRSRLEAGAFRSQGTSITNWFNFTLSAAVFLRNRLIWYLTECSNWRMDSRHSEWFLKNWIQFQDFLSCNYLYLIVMNGNTIYLYQTKCCIGIWGSNGYDCKRDCSLGWAMKPCGLVDMYGNSRGSGCLHYKARRITRSRN
jgi:hypothetical protein